MKLKYCATFGKNLYYLGDENDDLSPQIRLEFLNDLADYLPDHIKEKIGDEVMKIALERINYIFCVN